MTRKFVDRAIGGVFVGGGIGVAFSPSTKEFWACMFIYFGLLFVFNGGD